MRNHQAASEMIGRVARAIWSLNDDADSSDYDLLSPSAKWQAEKLASAAIAAMRRPTEGMIDRLADVLIEHNEPTVCDVRAVWNALIDAALGRQL